MRNQGIFLLRADQYQHDPGEWFVKPQVDIACLDSGTHPIRLIGSRGCGKTMLLRSIAGKPLGESILSNDYQATNRLRIYIRPDNQLMGGMAGWGLGENIWKTASLELILLRILEEATNKINHWLTSRRLEPLRFNDSTFSFNQSGEILSDWIRLKQHTLYSWARCPEGKPPVVIAALSSLAALIKTAESYIDSFPQDLSVSVYFDEQETYLKYQQVIINDWIKNPPIGWVFHVAHRRYLDYVQETSTDEVIEESNDFRVIDLDEPLIGSVQGSASKRENFYKSIIFNEVRRHEEFDVSAEKFSPDDLLPSYKSKLADLLRDDKFAQDAWKRLTERSSKVAKVNLPEMVKEGQAIEDAKNWVMWPIIVARGKNQDPNWQNDKNFRHNYLNGAVLQIYFEAKGRAPMHYYCGFSALCSIVLSNVREFILILQQAIDYERLEDDKKKLGEILKGGISGTSQYKAVIARSKQFNNIIAISAAERGHAIEQALHNWLQYFSLSQRLPTLPYNEPNHIICSDSIDKTSTAWKTIKAGEKHGAFIFTHSSKQRESTKDNQHDIRIHPLLCVMRYLSYAKRNTPSLNFDTIARITNTTDEDEIKSLASRNEKNLSGRQQLTIF